MIIIKQDYLHTEDMYVVDATKGPLVFRFPSFKTPYVIYRERRLEVGSFANVSFLPILYQMDQLQRLYNENVGITAKQLYTKALKEGLQVNRAVVQDFVKRRGDQQIFQQRKPRQGETAPRDEGEAQMDLIDMKAMKSGPYKNIIILGGQLLMLTEYTNWFYTNQKLNLVRPPSAGDS